MLLREPRPRPWTKDEYYEAAEAGWFDGQRFELIGGEVVEMPPQSDGHASEVSIVDYALRRVFGRGFVVRIQSPLDFGEDSQPEPDVAVVRGSPREVKKHPRTALLVVEVADTTLAYDRSRKARLYASRRVRDYWIVNLMDRQLEVRRRPAADGREPFGYEYAELSILRAGDVVTPLAAKGARIKVADLFF